MKKLPDINLIKTLFRYRNDGVLVRKQTVSSYTKNTTAGFVDNCGHLRVGILGKKYPVHRVIWSLLKNEDPYPLQIDHIDGNRANNRIENLRKVTNTVNSQNAKKRVDNTSGYPGVGYSKQNKKWRVRIGAKHLGYFSSKVEAIKARKKAEKVCKYHPNHGR